MNENNETRAHKIIQRLGYLMVEYAFRLSGDSVALPHWHPDIKPILNDMTCYARHDEYHHNSVTARFIRAVWFRLLTWGTALECYGERN